MIDDSKKKLLKKEFNIKKTKLIDILDNFNTLENLISPYILIDDAKNLYGLCIGVEHAVKRFLITLYSKYSNEELTKFFEIKINNIIPLNENVKKIYVIPSISRTLIKSCNNCAITIENSLHYADFGIISHIFKGLKFNELFNKDYKELALNIIKFKNLRNEIFHLRSENVEWKEIRAKTKLGDIPPEKKDTFNKIQWMEFVNNVSTKIHDELKNLHSKLDKLKNKD